MLPTVCLACPWSHLQLLLACAPQPPLLQNRQAEDAAQRPPFKRWVDEEVIERQFREKQEALAKEVGAWGGVGC